jgi:hypothetical protein
LQQAYELLFGDDYLKELGSIYEQVLEIKREEEPESTKYSSVDLTVEFSLVSNKIDAGIEKESSFIVFSFF